MGRSKPSKVPSNASDLMSHMTANLGQWETMRNVVCICHGGSVFAIYSSDQVTLTLCSSTTSLKDADDTVLYFSFISGRTAVRTNACHSCKGHNQFQGIGWTTWKRRGFIRSYDSTIHCPVPSSWRARSSALETGLVPTLTVWEGSDEANAIVPIGGSSK